MNWGAGDMSDEGNMHLDLRIYGTSFHLRGLPGLTSWVIIGRPSGAGTGLPAEPTISVSEDVLDGKLLRAF